MADDKILYLVRHAKSSWSDISLSDFDRPLNKRGQRDAPVMGKRLKQRGVQPDAILSSPAKRAIDTAELIAGKIGVSNKSIIRDQSIYEATIGELLTLIQALPDRFGSAMLFGHNPAMEGLVNLLSETHIERMPTCAIVTLQFSSPHWKDAGSCPAKLLDFDYPKNPSVHDKL